MASLIYVADDEQNIRELIQNFLEDDGHEVHGFSTGDDLYAAFLKRPADLVILDIMMPGTDGYSICANLRKQSEVPIILLTARDTDADMVTGFTMGADDYFNKPFSPVKLSMRVKVMLKRNAKQGNEGSEELSFGDMHLLPAQKTAFVNAEEIKLTSTEFSLLSYMFERQSKAVSREELLNGVWGYDNFVETRVTDDTIKRLRKKLMQAGSEVSLDTVWGFGFKLGRRVDV